jgi:hypothetical protein
MGDAPSWPRTPWGLLRCYPAPVRTSITENFPALARYWRFVHEVTVGVT